MKKLVMLSLLAVCFSTSAYSASKAECEQWKVDCDGMKQDQAACELAEKNFCRSANNM